MLLIENKSLIQLKNNYISLSYFIYNCRKIRIPFLGGYSTGKSSVLNCLIGKNILPVDLNQCTKRGIIIRHNKTGISQLFKTKFIKIENPEYWYFQEEENPFCEGDEQIKETLKELNQEKVEFENSFIVLKIPLKIFSELNLNNNELKEELMEKLEFIDFPGLDIKDNFIENIFSPLMRFSDGFIFVNDCDLIEEKGNLDIIENIMNEIKIYKPSFNYNSCLFLLNKSEKDLDLDINKSRKIFENLFFNNKLNDNINKLNLNKFSCQLYNLYITFFDKYIKDFESFIKYIVYNLVKPEEKLKLTKYEEFLILINNIILKLKNKIKNDLPNIDKEIKYDKNSINKFLFNLFKIIKSKNNINQQEKINDNKIISIIDELYINYSYLINNCKFHIHREASNANSFFDSLLLLFNNLYQQTEKQFKKYYDLFIENINNLFSLMDLQIYGNIFEGQLSYNNHVKIYKELDNNALNIYNELINEIKDVKNKVIKDIENNINVFYYSYCNDRDNNNLKELDKLEKEIKKSFDSYINYMNIQIGKFNQINLKLNILITSRIKNYYSIILDRNCNKYDELSYSDNTIINIFKGILNVFISIRNRFNEKDLISENLSKYFLKITDLLNKYENTFIKTITSIKKEISKKINENIINVTTDFNKIKNKKSQYEKIKEEFNSIIYKKY